MLTTSSRSGGEEGLKGSACAGSVPTIGIGAVKEPERMCRGARSGVVCDPFVSKAVVDADAVSPWLLPFIDGDFGFKRFQKPMLWVWSTTGMLWLLSSGGRSGVDDGEVAVVAAPPASRRATSSTWPSWAAKSS